MHTRAHRKITNKGMTHRSQIRQSIVVDTLYQFGFDFFFGPAFVHAEIPSTLTRNESSPVNVVSLMRTQLLHGAAATINDKIDYA